ncbi:MAG: Holliday junction ATP-dependent DNA helicase RuvA [Oligoflexia bacterium]|nr:MAG: Holliday junction ATP-dependent DNA helicase RuvA [Oligoflexia bacterium]
MIAYLQGQVFDITPEALVLMVNGVGYELICSQNTLSDFESLRGKDTFLHVYTHVREDALQLFGFESKTEKQLFLSLLKVNGIGPKMAIHILSGARMEQIMEMIEKEDVKSLSKLPKVGKKTAEQMILALKGKLILTEDVKSTAGAVAGPQREISSALVNLGFRAQDVEKVVTQLPKTIDFEEGLRQGLAALTTL